MKIGSGWAYGIRVISTVDDDAADRRSISSRSASSSSSYKDYEIWRRWDDCLWFQETLQIEYSIQAREKRRRLEQGKGVKKNGVYLNSKHAASFESLPPGPDPTSVSLDIHKHIPKLSKKATLFRVNQATIDQRQQQFTSLIEALLAPEVPTLVEELRATCTIRDFFGWWRRDKDFSRKHGPEKGKGPEIPILDSIPFYIDTSGSSQIFSTPDTSRDPTRPRSKTTRPTTSDGTTSDSRWHSPRSHSHDDVSSRRRRTTPAATPSPTAAIPSPSVNDSHQSRPSSRASLYSTLSGELSPSVVMWDGQEQLSANDRISPNAILNAFPQTPMVRETFENIQCPPSPEADSPILGLEVLPEESELELPPPRLSAHEQEPEAQLPIARPRGNSASDGRHRNAIVFSPEMALSDAESPEVPDRSPTMTNATTASSRHSSLFSNTSFAPSWRTSTSDIPPFPSPRQSLESFATDTIDYSCTGFPVTPQTPWFPDSEGIPILGPATKRNRGESIASIDSIMSDASADHVLPRSPQSGDASVTRSFSKGPRSRPLRFVPMSVPEEEVSVGDCDDVILESYLYGGYHVRSFPVQSWRPPPSPLFWERLYAVASFTGCLSNQLYTIGIEEVDASESESEDHNPYRKRLSQHPTPEQLPKPFQNRPPEQFHLPWTPIFPSADHLPSSVDGGHKPPTSPISMASTSTLSLRTISIKAYLTEDAIVVFRVTPETTYAEIRDKIYDKFVNQEGISLRHDFPLAYLVPDFSRRSTVGSACPGITRKRAESVGSASANKSSLLRIQSQEGWDEIMRDSDGKLTLRVFE